MRHWRGVLQYRTKGLKVSTVLGMGYRLPQSLHLLTQTCGVGDWYKFFPILQPPHQCPLYTSEYGICVEDRSEQIKSRVIHPVNLTLNFPTQHRVSNFLEAMIKILSICSFLCSVYDSNRISKWMNLHSLCQSLKGWASRLQQA